MYKTKKKKFYNNVHHVKTICINNAINCKVATLRGSTVTFPAGQLTKCLDQPVGEVILDGQ